MPRPAPRAPGFGSAWTALDPPLSPWIADVIAAQGFERMTPVQAGTIPRAVKHQDCVVEAVTGSGKTLAFVVPVLERMVRNEHKYKKGEVAAIVIAPTRELASQIHQVFNMFLETLQPPPPEPVEGEEPPPPVPGEYPLAALVTSGTNTPYDTFFMQHSNIIVGTPGRLASFLLGPRGMNAVRVGNLDVLVLDEADRLLSAPDHRRDVERIMRHLPKQRRTHLFSATMTDAVEEMVGLGLRNPVRIVVNLKDKRSGEAQERRVPMALQNMYTVCNAADKTLQLIRILDHATTRREAAKMIIYFSTCAAVDYFYRVLSRLPELERFALTSFHGDLPPRVRESALAGFTSHPSSHLTPAVLLCTDVAARGVDFPDIDVVVQYDAPTDPKTFSHRVGRTARAGRAGRAVLLVSRGREEEYINLLSVRKIPLTRTGYLSATLDELDTPPAAPADPDSLDLLSRIRAITLTDRDLSDRGAKAMVSSVRAYTKNEATFIFRPSEIDFGALGTVFGVLRLPAMPEIRDWRRRAEKKRKMAEKRAAAAAAPPPEGEAAKQKEDAGDHEDEVDDDKVEPADDIPQVTWTDADVDWDTFAYATKARETARLATLAEKRAKAAAEGPTTSGSGAVDATVLESRKRKIRAEVHEAWSNQKDRKVRRDERREKKDVAAKVAWERKMAAGELEADAPAPEARAAGKRNKRVLAALVGSDDETDGRAGEREKDANAMADEYRSLKREVNEERAAKKAQRNSHVKESAGMFDDLD